MTQLRDRRPTTALLDRRFRLKERGTTVAREVRGGITTFVAMAYIVCSTR